jgi:hypothetical protein
VLSLPTLALVLLAGGPVTSVTGAQQRPPTPPRDSARQPGDTASLDSLRARLARAEAAIELLREQLAGESESTVHTRSRLRVELLAQVLTNGFLTLGRVNNVDVPTTVLPPPPAGAEPPTNDALGFTLRQTRIGATVSVADVLGATFGGDVDFDLFGGVQNGPGDRRLFPEPRLRTARAQLAWPRTEIMVGSDAPLISMLNPMSLAAVGVPDFSAAGNLWNWLGQLRITRELGALGSRPASPRVAIQGAVLAPYANALAALEPDAVDAAERSRRPSFEGRLRFRWGEEEERFITGTAIIADPGGEIGIGVHRGWVATAPGVTENSHALSLDVHVVPVRGVELRGEAYGGQLLRGLGGGGIAQNFGAGGDPVSDIAGWLQLNVQPHPVLITGLGCGVDLVDPDASPARLQNTVCAAHAAWRPIQPLVIGIEYRQLGTRLPSGTFGARHVNIVFGFEL